MQTIKIYGEINQEMLDKIEILEKNVTFVINSKGGFTQAGLDFYNKMRSLDVNFYSIIEGECSSIAMIIHMIAPIESRFCVRSAKALIHEVFIDSIKGEQTAEDLERVAAYIEHQNNQISTIIAERTDNEVNYIRDLMKKAEYMDAQQLLYNNICIEIQPYTSNKSNYSQKYIEMKNFNSKLAAFLIKTAKTLNQCKETELETESGLLTIEGEMIEVGVPATPDGEFIYGGERIFVENGVITNIEPVEETEEPIDEFENNCGSHEKKEEEEETMNNEPRETELQAEVASLKEQLAEALELLDEMKREMKSDFTVPSRNANEARLQTKAAAYNSDEVKRQISENLDKCKKKQKTK